MQLNFPQVQLRDYFGSRANKKGLIPVQTSFEKTNPASAVNKDISDDWIWQNWMLWVVTSSRSSQSGVHFSWPITVLGLFQTNLGNSCFVFINLIVTETVSNILPLRWLKFHNWLSRAMHNMHLFHCLGMLRMLLSDEPAGIQCWRSYIQPEYSKRSSLPALQYRCSLVHKIIRFSFSDWKCRF